MLSLKICGIIMVITSMTGMGFALSRNMKLRLDALSELKKILCMLRGEIKYTGTPLYEAFGVIGRRTGGIYSDFFIQTSEELEALNGKSLREIWGGLRLNMKRQYLNEKDWERLMQFGDNLGYLDKEMQLGTIELYIEHIEAELSEGSANYGKNSRLYKALFISGGLLITIMLI